MTNLRVQPVYTSFVIAVVMIFGMQMHSLGYDVRLDRADGETTAPAQYAGLARTLAQAPQEVCVLWFTRRVGRGNKT